VNEPHPSAGTDLALGVFMAGAALGGVLWAAGAASALISGHRVPEGHYLSGLEAFDHFGDPSAAWASPVGPAVLYWPLALLAVLAGALVAYVACKLWRSFDASKPADPSRAEGMATRNEVRQVAGAKALVSRSGDLRRSLERPRPVDIGFRLGTARGVACWASVEDSVLVLGPPRSGKGLHLVVPMVLDAPGAVVTTSTRPDNLALTLTARAGRGPVMVFDPQGLAGSGGHLPLLRWPLTRGCEEAHTAMVRAQALVPAAGSAGVENANFWRAQALSVTRCLLHAAALDCRPAADLYRWSHAAGAAKEAITVLGSHPGAVPGWDRALDAVVSAEQRTRDSIWAMVANTFAPLADPAVLASLSPDPSTELDPLAFLAMRGSVYLLGTASGASAAATLVAALVEDLVESARKLAARSPGQRLDPPLALVLDEAANYPLPSLPSLMSEGGGSGITTIAVLQSLAQARDRWGREAAEAIWDAAIVKVVLGGSANADDLADLSRLTGERAVREWSETHHGSQAGRSVSSSVRYRPVLEASELRRLRFGTALLLLRSAAPVVMVLRPWTARPDAPALRAAREAWENEDRA
jgi:type IV secretory pathway TraG/TraD family ATPase VirD4